MFVSFEIKGGCLLALAIGWSAEVSRIAGTILTRPDAAYFQMDSVKSVSSRNVSLSVQLIEEQARGALHFHVAVAGRQMYALLRSIWQGILGRGPNGEQMGQVHVRDPHRFGFGVAGAHKIASYMAKYRANEMQCRALDQKRYFRSRASWCRQSMYGGCRFVQTCCALRRPHSRRYQVIAWMACRLGPTVYLASAPQLPQAVGGYPFKIREIWLCFGRHEGLIFPCQGIVCLNITKN